MSSNMPQGNKPFFSIIVPAYNVEQYISECIDSVFAQSFTNFELIIVDDGSTDHTGEICDKLTLSAANAKVIHQANAGLSAARNAGIAKANGEYLILLDGDDYLEPDALAVIHDELSITHPVDLLRFQAQEIFENGKIIKYPEPGFPTMTGVTAFQKIAHYHYIENAWLYAYRREFFMENHFQYAEGCIAEDFGLTLLVLARAKSVKSISHICYDYRQRTGSITRGAAPVLRRTEDIERQLKQILPLIAQIPHTKSILYYLVVSYLTSATLLSQQDFLKFYQSAKQAGWLRYIHPVSLRSIPRAFILRHFPKLFYRVYRRRG